jgi:hypothetical protein
MSITQKLLPGCVVLGLPFPQMTSERVKRSIEEYAKRLKGKFGKVIFIPVKDGHQFQTHPIYDGGELKAMFVTVHVNKVGVKRLAAILDQCIRNFDTPDVRVIPIPICEKDSNASFEDVYDSGKYVSTIISVPVDDVNANTWKIIDMIQERINRAGIKAVTALPVVEREWLRIESISLLDPSPSILP